MPRPLLLAVLLVATIGSPLVAQSTPAKKLPTNRERAIAFCREESLTRLKYVKTVKWSDIAREESSATWLISGIRTAKGPDGNADQQYTCRVELSAAGPSLRMIQIFKESSKTGKDVFEVRR